MIQINGSVRMQVRIQLNALAQEDYRLFQSRLVPGITGILGVRTPDLRRLGKDQTGRKVAGIYRGGVRGLEGKGAGRAGSPL